MARAFDLVVLGGSSGASDAACRAGALGLSVAFVEPERVGDDDAEVLADLSGVLCRAVDVLETCRQAESYGIGIKGLSSDMKPIVIAALKEAERRSKERRGRLVQFHVERFIATPRLIGSGGVELSRGGKVVEFLSSKHILIATGKVSVPIVSMPIDGRLIWSERDAWTSRACPASILIVGGQERGLSLALFYTALGADVTLMSRDDQLLPLADLSVSAFAHDFATKRGITVILKANIQNVEKNGKNVRVSLEQGIRSTLHNYERIVALGSDAPDTAGLGLENTKAQVKLGMVAVSPWFITDEPGLYAIGDVLSSDCFPALARQQALVCVERLAGSANMPMLDRAGLPRCVGGGFSTASVGMTEAEARAKFIKLRRGTASYDGQGGNWGLATLLFEATTGSLLGAHLVGCDAPTVIAGLTLAQKLETTEQEILQTIFPGVPLAHAVQDAVRQAFAETERLKKAV